MHKRYLLPSQIAKLIKEEDEELGSIPIDDSQTRSIDFRSMVNEDVKAVDILHANGKRYFADIARSNGEIVWIGRGHRSKTFFRNKANSRNTSLLGTLTNGFVADWFKISPTYNYVYDVNTQYDREPIGKSQVVTGADPHKIYKFKSLLNLMHREIIAEEHRQYIDRSASRMYIGDFGATSDVFAPGGYAREFVIKMLEHIKLPKYKELKPIIPALNFVRNMTARAPFNVPQNNTLYATGWHDASFIDHYMPTLIAILMGQISKEPNLSLYYAIMRISRRYSYRNRDTVGAPTRKMQGIDVCKAFNYSGPYIMTFNVDNIIEAFTTT